MTFKELDSKLTGRNTSRRKLANNTYAHRNADGSIAIQLHSTDILTFHPDGRTVVTSGGWQTSTTKARLNDYMPHGLGISQRGGIWYWSGGEVFQDGATIGARGGITYNGTPANEKGLAALRKRVNAFASLCANAVPLPLPGAGDCFYCQMVVSEGPDKGKALGDACKDRSHLESHMEEGYAVPSLVYRALKERGCTDFILALAFKTQNGEVQSANLSGLAKDHVRRAVRKFMFRRLGMAA